MFDCVAACDDPLGCCMLLLEVTRRLAGDRVRDTLRRRILHRRIGRL